MFGSGLGWQSSPKCCGVVHEKTFHGDLRSLSVAIGRKSPRYFSYDSGVPGNRVATQRDRPHSATQIMAKLN
jgi:hypothetical protein